MNIPNLISPCIAALASAAVSRRALCSMLALVSLAPGAQAATMVPADAQASCTVPQANFNSWFASGSVSLNGLVLPADSVNFNHTTALPPSPLNTLNCNFYLWSQQMFLWLSSPVTSGYGKAGTRVFDSPLFYNVLADGSVLPNTPGMLQGLRTRTGKPVNLAVEQADGIDNPAPFNRGAALMGQGDKLVYYSMHINDVYAYFAKLNVPQPPNPANPPPATLAFPSNAAGLAPIVAYASTLGVTFPDANALTMEVKAAWIEVSEREKSKYVTMMGEIPTYIKSKTKWTQNHKRKALLGLVGMHVVGSVNGHPEMIWATFEHQDNSPNGGYSYIDTNGKTITLPREVPKNMLFAVTGARGPFNQEHMQASASNPLDLTAISPHSISPSNTMRAFPWGATGFRSPNPLVGSPAASNTEVISINNNIRGMLDQSDIRKNYLFIGATWTEGGAAPTAMNAFSSNQVGTSSLANTTMETYVTVKNGLNNCFACHTSNLVGVSHIFNTLNTAKVK